MEKVIATRPYTNYVINLPREGCCFVARGNRRIFRMLVTFPKWHWLIKEILVAIFVLVELDLVYASLSSINAFVRTRAYTGRNAPVTM
jgi:hypothetical protein